MTYPITFAVLSSSLSAVALVEASSEPWWIAAIVIPIAGFAAFLVRYILQKQDERDKTVNAREDRREAREEKRAEQADAQTRALEKAVVELSVLGAQHVQIMQQIREIPEHVANRLQKNHP